MNTTAEEWVNQQFEKQRITTNGNDDVYCSRQGIVEACQIFAKLHVETALKARDELYETYYEEEINWTEENKKFIRDSYPLSNIK